MDHDNDSDDAKGAENGPKPLWLDACLELLADRQRRLILEFFIDKDREHASLDEIVSAIVEDEARTTGQRPGHNSVAATLYHVHLPRFADAGILEYDSRNLQVRYYGNPQIEQVFSKIEELEWES